MCQREDTPKDEKVIMFLVIEFYSGAFFRKTFRRKATIESSELISYAKMLIIIKFLKKIDQEVA